MLRWRVSRREREGAGMIEWRDNADEAKADALRLRRPILIDVFKDP